MVVSPFSNYHPSYPLISALIATIDHAADASIPDKSLLLVFAVAAASTTAADYDDDVDPGGDVSLSEQHAATRTSTSFADHSFFQVSSKLH